MEDVGARVEGVGGAFILSEDPDRLATWYRDVLGIELEPHSGGKGFYKVFQTRDPNTGVLRANPVFAIQPAHGPLPSPRAFVINLRVDDLVEFLKRLREKGQESEPIVDDPYGLFSAVSDCDGNRIELYEEKFPEER